ncbi:MAG: hypothetical protein AB7N91_14235 [Candidatus Tectimicrobiota bacterium]
MRVKHAIKGTLALGGLLYPFAVYFERDLPSPHLAFVLIGICMANHLLARAKCVPRTRLLTPVILVAVLYILGALLGHPGFLLYVPVLIAASLMLSFGYSLLVPPSMIEVFARMLVPSLSAEERAYCRQVTCLWVGFFLCNGIVAFFTACCASLGLWSLYNGLIVYMIMGLLFALEIGYRSWRFRRYAGLPTDCIFKKLFPPREEV